MPKSTHDTALFSESWPTNYKPFLIALIAYIGEAGHSLRDDHARRLLWMVLKIQADHDFGVVVQLGTFAFGPPFVDKPDCLLLPVLAVGAYPGQLTLDLDAEYDRLHAAWTFEQQLIAPTPHEA